MEFLIELLFELIFEGGVEVSKNKKISKFIRYPLIFLIVLFFSFIIFLLLFLGLSIANTNILVGLLIIIISFIFLIFSIKKFKEVYLEKKEDGDIDGTNFK